MYNKRGELSIVRIGVIAGIIGILVIGLGIASFFFDQRSRNTPLEVAVYPGAETWGERDVRPTSRRLFYRIRDVEAEQVADHYQGRLNEHSGSQDRCVRLPESGENEINPNNPFSIPYQFVCLFDRSQSNATQYTRVVIYPGTANADPFLNSEGYTVIEYEQVWMP
jgi:hypothetical protein